VEAARWITVRFTAVRTVAEVLAGGVDERELRVARNVALKHLRSLPAVDREAWSLKRMLIGISAEPHRSTVTALLQAGAAAAVRGHGRGAYAMFHIAYRLSRPRGWHAEAGRAARGFERLATRGGAVYSPRLWRRRARLMEERAAVA
jgi:hypothetical protein